MAQKPMFVQHYVVNVSKVYTKNTAIQGETEEFSAISFKNIGDVDLTVNDFPLPAGSTMVSYRQELPAIDRTEYQIVFDPAGVGSKQVYVNQTKVVRSVVREVDEVCLTEKGK